MRAVLLGALLAACYEPDAVDCTVQCGGPDDCADGQVCGTDGYCAAPDVAGTCMVSGQPPQVALVIAIEGHGKVSIEHVGSCDSAGPTEGNCTFPVAAGDMQQLKAVESNDRKFLSWTSTCSGTSSSCTLTVTALTQVGAKFE